ncbi:phosphoethanolamine--lipid A transferase [Fulvimarina sp. 2208YS6-2-32]|uniref:Phosphoethanolamine--lipid A transferase n=1 Tax=Fulvimarina uroteuthidis TaxID=3098149 RepID=A0ABU5I649_9HYPH|nr:phosphoethanolamine--lipid A transferase [Fulvimarina sp. 2208YS6-2-32]MDY8110865.1 phosphoethanolamine--lipid A transferase [Fulvimarina sp. 2208YS6-2-32]
MKRPSLTSIQLSMLVTLFVLATANATFWMKAWTYFEEFPGTLVGFAIALFLLGSSLLTMFSMKYVIKPVFIVFVLIAAVSSYYVDTFGIVVDRDMIRNALETTAPEAGAFVTPNFIVHIVIYGFLPAVCIAWVRIRHRAVLAKARWNTAFILPSVLVVLGIVFLNFSVFAATFRNHHDLMASLNPASAIVGVGKVIDRHFQNRNQILTKLGEDARSTSRGNGTRPKVLVLVAGETARAHNFGLLGYERDTNPELSKRDVVAFSNVSSCGTATAVSLPCMFSVYPRDDYTETKGKWTENLLDVLGHAGIKTLWLDNNTGSKGVADRTAYEFLPDTADPSFCEDGECRDDVLANRLKEVLVGVKNDTVIVLHQIGSHGPAYFRRYGEEARRFEPDCRTPQLADCTSQELVNAYDNTIVQTDRNLGQIIDSLREQSDRIDAAMIYVSDHGESLGESGLYLHAAPYFMAPKGQTHVPMIAWFSDAFAKDDGLDQSCIEARRAEPLSHDSLFHSVLGLMSVMTKVYDPALDFSVSCRETGPGTSSPQPQDEEPGA